jgi:cytochrome c oxidase subunit 4
MGHSHLHIDDQIRTYLMVFVGLLVLTGATVAAWKLEFLPAGPAIGLALVIAMAKGALVALFFMHLSAENKIIYWILLLTVLFFFALLFLPLLTASDAVSL